MWVFFFDTTFILFFIAAAVALCWKAVESLHGIAPILAILAFVIETIAGIYFLRSKRNDARRRGDASQGEVWRSLFSSLICLVVSYIALYDICACESVLSFIIEALVSGSLWLLTVSLWFQANTDDEIVDAVKHFVGEIICAGIFLFLYFV